MVIPLSILERWIFLIKALVIHIPENDDRVQEVRTYLLPKQRICISHVKTYDDNRIGYMRDVIINFIPHWQEINISFKDWLENVY